MAAISHGVSVASIAVDSKTSIQHCSFRFLLEQPCTHRIRPNHLPVHGTKVLTPQKPAELAALNTAGKIHATLNRNTEVPADAWLLTMRQLEALTQLHRTRLYGFIRQGKFPAPLKLGKTSRWHRPAVE